MLAIYGENVYQISFSEGTSTHMKTKKFCAFLYKCPETVVKELEEDKENQINVDSCSLY